MFGFDFWEMVVILVVALLVVGPERLPKLARTTGLWIGKLKRMASNLREELEDEFEAVELKQILTQQQQEINELRGMLNESPLKTPSAKPAPASSMMKAVESELGAAGTIAATEPPAPTPTSAMPAHEKEADR
jgi:sec-independent protein translocase protein TatB